MMNSDGSVLNETTQHQRGQAVADFTISLPQSVDVCTLNVKISAGNSAGISTPSETVEVAGKLTSIVLHYLHYRKSKPVCLLYLGCSGDSTDSTTTINTGDGVNHQPPKVLIGKVYPPVADNNSDTTHILDTLRFTNPHALIIYYSTEVRSKALI